MERGGGRGVVHLMNGVILLVGLLGILQQLPQQQVILEYSLHRDSQQVTCQPSHSQSINRYMAKTA